jgi:oxygen-independent coproporphyrinogen-3 oxidase
MAGLYLHIPFCRRKCFYCDFYSVEAEQAKIESYPNLLKQNLAWAAKSHWPDTIDTIYFGGGTPSLLTPQAVAEILRAVDQHFSIDPSAEISMEANPGTVTLESLRGYRSAGVNRLSLGLQTCDEKQLTHLGRLHGQKAGIDAVNWSRQAGFDNISLDLMFALPKQTFTDLEDDLSTYLELAPEHLSCYGLTAEEGTPLYQQVASGKLALPDEDFYADAFMRLHDGLTSAGYEHYEIANYSLPDFNCRHNLNYWRRGAYLGLGAGAHSFRDQQWGSRWEVPADVGYYQQALHDKEEPMKCLETFEAASALRETVYLALRTQRGITDAELQQRFDCTFQEAFPEAIDATAQWLVHEGDRWSLTTAGWLLFDRLILAFL